MLLKRPDRPQQLLLGENACRLAGARAQQGELLLRELDARAAKAHLTRRRVDLEVADAQAAEGPPPLARRSSAVTRPRSSGYENGLRSHSLLGGLFGPIPVRRPAEPERQRKPYTARTRWTRPTAPPKRARRKAAT
jgi:hypothetical protein